MKLELRSVRLKNCGPLDDVKLDFFDASGKTLPVCVIGGANGSGKTTILEVIVWLAKVIEGSPAMPVHSNREMYYQADWRLDEVDFSLSFGTDPSDLVRQRHHLHVTENGFTFTPSPAITELARRLVQQQSGGELIKPEYFSASTPIPSIIYFPYGRAFETITGDNIYKEEDVYHFVYKIEKTGKFEGSFNSYLIWLDYADPEQFSQIQASLNELYDGKIFRVDRKQLSAIVKTSNGEEHSINKLSSGEQNLLITLMELRRKLTPGSIVLIDEIENSLHPAFQHRLAQGLLKLQKEIPYQLIVTTHARAFVEIFGTENTLLLTPF